MALKSKNSWGDVFNTSKQSQPLTTDKEKKFSRDDSFARFAKNTKYRGGVSDYKLDDHDFVYIEDSDSLFTKLIKRFRMGLNQLIQLFKKT
jgi:hypothetical protein